MATRLHTQHHPAGGLRPATPTCCSCCCCCVGSSVGTLTILPVMIARAAVDRQSGRAAARPEPSGGSDTPPATGVPAPKPGLPPWKEGIAAFMLAAVPVLILMLWPDPTVLLITLATAVLALTAWASIQMYDSGRGAWPPLVSTFVVLPLAFGAEFYLGLGATSEGGSSEYWYLAFAIGAIVFALGLLFAWLARRR